MNRFDKKFNNVDPITSRPFSSGHPGGVWLISILYGLAIVVPAIGILVTLVMFFFTGTFNPAALAATAISLALFLPLIILLFKRSAKSIFMAIFLLLVFSGVSAFSYITSQDGLYVAIGLCFAQLYVIYYMLGLKKDQLLGVKHGNTA
jgi:hypothetical protein